MITDAIKSIYDKYGVENIRKCEEYVNIIRPDKNSIAYKEFIKSVEYKVKTAMEWLTKRNIEYTWNEQIDGHLYRLVLPNDNLLFDFEYYPVNNMNYNYIRINYNTDIIKLLEGLFPETVLDTKELAVWKITQKACNKFLKENNAHPIYDKSILRLAFVKESTIYQCILVKGNTVVANVTKSKCGIPYGTYMLLRYLNEVFEIPEIVIKSDLDNSYITTKYQILNLKVIKSTSKRKIWINSESAKWHISENDKSKYIPFYLTESITYKYP